jgi:Ulp1 family protease
MYASDATVDFCLLYMEIKNANARLKDNVFILSALMHSHLRSLKLNNDFSLAWYIRSNKLDGVNDLLIPIVWNDHFSALVIRNIRSSTPEFYHYDSTVNYHNTEEIVELFSEYLQALQQAQRVADRSDEDPFKITRRIIIKLKGPVQGNSYDCGIYMLKFFKQILDSDDNIETFLESFNNTAWSHDDILNYRKAMYDIAIRLYDEFESSQNMIATQNIVRSIEENRYTTKHKENESRSTSSEQKSFY